MSGGSSPGFSLSMLFVPYLLNGAAQSYGNDSAVSKGTSSSNIHHCGRSSRQERRGQQCPRDLPQRVYLPAAACPGGWRLSSSPHVKEKRKSKAGESQDMHQLTIPLGRGSQVPHRYPASPMCWKENFSPSALGESRGANKHPL